MPRRVWTAFLIVLLTPSVLFADAPNLFASDYQDEVRTRPERLSAFGLRPAEESAREGVSEVRIFTDITFQGRQPTIVLSRARGRSPTLSAVSLAAVGQNVHATTLDEPTWSRLFAAVADTVRERKAAAARVNAEAARGDAEGIVVDLCADGTTTIIELVDHGEVSRVYGHCDDELERLADRIAGEVLRILPGCSQAAPWRYAYFRLSVCGATSGQLGPALAVYNLLVDHRDDAPEITDQLAPGISFTWHGSAPVAGRSAFIARWRALSETMQLVVLPGSALGVSSRRVNARGLVAAEDEDGDLVYAPFEQTWVRLGDRWLLQTFAVGAFAAPPSG